MPNEESGKKTAVKKKKWKFWDEGREWLLKKKGQEEEVSNTTEL